MPCLSLSLSSAARPPAPLAAALLAVVPRAYYGTDVCVRTPHRLVSNDSLPLRRQRKQTHKEKSRRVLVKEAAWVASNVAAGPPEHRAALVGLGAPAALTSLLQSDMLDLQQEAAYGVWNIVAHDYELLLQASRDDRVMAAYVALVRAQSPPVVRCVVFCGARSGLSVARERRLPLGLSMCLWLVGYSFDVWVRAVCGESCGFSFSATHKPVITLRLSINKESSKAETSTATGLWMSSPRGQARVPPHPWRDFSRPGGLVPFVDKQPPDNTHTRCLCLAALSFPFRPSLARSRYLCYRSGRGLTLFFSPCWRGRVFWGGWFFLRVCRRCALSFLQLVCQNVPGGPRMVESAGGLEAIDDVHYSGRVCMCAWPVTPFLSSSAVFFAKPVCVVCGGDGAPRAAGYR